MFYKIALILYIVAELDGVKADLPVSFSRYFRSDFFFPNLPIVLVIASGCLGIFFFTLCRVAVYC